MTASSHIHNTDQSWMLWLRKCSRVRGQSGQTLFYEYNTDAELAFSCSIEHLTNNKCNDWSFMHNSSTALSSCDIAMARHRYLDKYPLTGEDKCSQVYVDALLSVESAQLSMRQGSSVVCRDCAQKNATIAKLRTLLTTQHMQIDDDAHVDAEVLKSLFMRHFILNGVSSTSRSEVRETLESVMKEEIGPEQVLPVSSPAWRELLYKTLGASSGNNSAIRCLRRLHPLPLGYQD